MVPMDSMADSQLWYLKQIDLFKGLPEAELKYVSSCFRSKKYDKDTELPDVHDEDSVFLVKYGVVELYALTEDGRKIIIEILGDGSVFGNLPDSENIAYFARVKKNALVCRMMTEEFFKLVSKYPSVSEKLLRSMYSSISIQKERISSLAAESVPERLRRLLRMISTQLLAEQNVSFTHEELAQMIGTSRQTVTTLINSLVKEGKLTKQGRQYRLVA
ncbi:MAG: hypothetical protein COU69_02170 [Candidatus Pacebacteria bacterium CG10_big_fil_rev_8_21_14_0_10_56_10]|nr:MAG: hypothetical protein COU69_02170 [Candidatus Pacebacteria bacterium CG10_big_fil_rev_8_21_14_0_10_56_10]